MTSERVRFWVMALTLLAGPGASKLQSNQNHPHTSILNSPVDEKTVVRFFYDPPGEYFHKPLVFRVVKEDDPLLNTASVHDEGQTAYISLPEMRGLVKDLAHTSLAWRESQSVEVLGPYKKLPASDDMEILIAFSDGTAKAEISPKALCMILRPLDAAFKAPRVLWEFQGFRLNYGCKVPGFKPGAYPDV